MKHANSLSPLVCYDIVYVVFCIALPVVAQVRRRENSSWKEARRRRRKRRKSPSQCLVAHQVQRRFAVLPKHIHMHTDRCTNTITEGNGCCTLSSSSSSN